MLILSSSSPPYFSLPLFHFIGKNLQLRNIGIKRWDHAVAQKTVNENSGADKKKDIPYQQRDAPASRQHTHEPSMSNRGDTDG